MRKEIALAALAVLAAVAALAAVPAGARPRGVNGQIAFSRFDPALGDQLLFTINPDGSHEQQVLPFAVECPHWSPDGSRIATCGSGPPAAPPTAATAIINPDDGSYRVLSLPDPTLPTACGIWSPDATRLACDMFAVPADPSRTGIYSIRSFDGGGLARITSNPDGHDIPGDYSPDGRRFVFARWVDCANGPCNPVGLLVVNVNGTGLKQITPAGTLVHDGDGGSWSPQGNQIVFSRELTPDVRYSLWIVHADGTGLHEIHVPSVDCGGSRSDPASVGCLDPSWSPDGTKIVFHIRLGAGTRNIYTINADGSGLTQVSHGGADDSSDWGTHPLAS